MGERHFGWACAALLVLVSMTDLGGDSEQGGEAGPAYAWAPVRERAAALAASPFMPSSWYVF